MFLKFISDAQIDIMLNAFQKMEKSIDVISYSLEQVANEYLLKENKAAYAQFYSGPGVQAWRHLLSERGYGDIGNTDCTFVVPLNRFLNEHGLTIQLINMINQRIDVGNKSWFTALIMTLDELHSNAIPASEVPFDITMYKSERKTGNNLVQMIQNAYSRIRDEERKVQERSELFAKRAANFMDRLSAEEENYIGNYEEYSRFTNSRYFKYWDYKFQSDNIMEKQALSIIDLLTRFLKKHGLTLAQFNNINDRVEAENVSISYMEGVFADLHDLGHDRIGDIDPETVINWIAAQDFATGIENACPDELVDVED